MYLENILPHLHLLQYGKMKFPEKLLESHLNTFSVYYKISTHLSKSVKTKQSLQISLAFRFGICKNSK